MSGQTISAAVRPAHRFRLGQRVSFVGGLIYGAPSSASYTVTRLMPPVGKVFGYRIKGDGDTYERTADEGQLSPAFI